MPLFTALRLPLLLWLTLFAVHPVLGASPDRVKLQLQWKHQFEYAGFYMAIEKGFYADAGLEVELIEAVSDKAPVDRLLAGEADYALSYSSVVLDYLQGAPIVMLANYFKRSPLAIVAQPELTSPRDLVGKKMMGNTDSIQEITLLAMLKKFGVLPDMIDILPPAFSAQPFIDKQVDAMVVYKTNELYFIEKSGIGFNLFAPIDYGLKYYDLNLITTRADLEQHAGRASRLTKATNQGWQYALQHPEETIDIILAKYNTQNKSRESLRYEAERINEVILPELYPVGSIEEQRLYQIGQDFKANQLLNNNIPLEFEAFLVPDDKSLFRFNKAETAYLKTRKTITYCSDPDWMPFEKIEKGKHHGMASDYFELLRLTTGLDLKLVQTRSWSESLQFAKDRRCDMLSLAMATPEREKYMAFTRPFLSLPLVIATKTDTLFINDLAEVLDKPIGLVKGYAYHELLRQRYPGINLVEVESVEDGLDKVRTGDIFGFMDSLATIGYLLPKNYIGELKIAGKFGDQWNLSIAVRNDNAMLLRIMDKALGAITEEQHREIYNKWISVVYEKGVDYGLFIRIMVAAGVLLLLLAYHLFMQSRYLGRLKLANQEIVEKNRQLEIISTTDKLTGINNRGKLDEELTRHYELYKRYQDDFSLILVDVDLFKDINDHCGHLEGDRALEEVTGLIRQHIRKTDIIGRWGGEEFLIICAETSCEKAKVLAESLRKRVEEHDFRLWRPLTISAGVTGVTVESTVHSLLMEADKALYEAKHAGRNRVVSRGN